MTVRKIALFLLVLSAASGTAAGQSSQPFDMTGEQSGNPVAQPDVAAPESAYPPPLQLQPQPGAAESGAAPGVPMMVPAIRSGGDSAPALAAPAAEPTAPSPVVPAMPAAAAPAPETGAPAPVAAPQADATSASAAKGSAESSRFIIPQSSLRLEGENDQKAWTIFLTAQQAEQALRIDASYKNAIVVTPEVSRLRVLMNDRVVLEVPLASSDDFKTVSAEIPAGTLQAGANLLRFQAIQRHRTDCSVQSTYELWTDIDPTRTVLTFGGAGTASDLQALEDLPALGYGADGRTTIHVIAPRATDSAVAPLIVALAQSLALYGQYPNPSVVVTESRGVVDGPGALTVIVSPFAQLAGLLDHPPEGGATQPTVSFVPEPGLGRTVLLVTGGNWGQVQAAVEAIAARVDRPPDVVRGTLGTAAWSAPDVHFFTGRESATLDKLGVVSQQFSGRRFRVDFGVGVPSDFYASAYGEATLLLDAAYTPAVLPASHIDIYVNGQIAATTRIVNRSGGIFRHFPIGIPFRHFRPGINRIAIEAVLDTAADSTCGPGGSSAGPDRFALFDSSVWSMPAFARIGRRPDLAAFAGTGSPYNRQSSPSALVLGRNSTQTIASAATLMARLAMQAGRIVQVVLAAPGAVGDRPALFVGSASQISVDTFARLAISQDIRTAWKADTGYIARPPGLPAAPVPGAGEAEPEDTDVLFNRWREQLSDGGGWRGQISGFEDWMKRTFDISFATLRIGPSAATAFRPPAKASLLLAQGSSPGGTQAWTLLTAPNDEQLLAATRSLVAIDNWLQVGGQFSTYSAATGQVENVAPAEVTFIPTQRLSIQNARLIAANWLSSNIVFYAIGLITFCIVLGIATSGLLHRLGRPS